MLTLHNISISSLPIDLHMHGVLDPSQTAALDNLIQKRHFQLADSLVKKLTGAKMNYDAHYWPDVTENTKVTIEIAGITDTKNKSGVSFCKSIW